jgi:hypothetical protein
MITTQNEILDILQGRILVELTSFRQNHASQAYLPEYIIEVKNNLKDDFCREMKRVFYLFHMWALPVVLWTNACFMQRSFR